MLRRWLRDTRGVTSIEYALLGSLIAMVIVTSMTLLGTNLNASISGVQAGFAGIH